jgi:hypothetical protein
VNVKLLLLPEKINCTKTSVLWDVAPYRLVVGKGKGSGKVYPRTGPAGLAGE